MSQGWETVKVTGDTLLKRVKELVHEGNVRRVTVKQGSKTIAEFPVTIGVVGAVAAPMLAALGATAALLADCSIEVQREAPRRLTGSSVPRSVPKGRKKRE